MRRSAYSAAAVLASVALLTVGAPTVAQAYTSKELNICWTNNATGTMDLEAVADGPSYKTFSLDDGDCMAWNVRPGLYKLTVEDVDEFVSNLSDECEEYGQTHDYADTGNPASYPKLTIKIKRQNDSYKAYTLAALLNGQVDTTIKNNRRTLVSVVLNCTDTPPNFP